MVKLIFEQNLKIVYVTGMLTIFTWLWWFGFRHKESKKYRFALSDFKKQFLNILATRNKI